MMGLGAIAGVGWLGMGFIGLWMFLPMALVVGAVWLGTTGSTGHSRRRADDDAADAILRRRLAAGEIEAAQYAEARAALGLTGEA